MGVGRLSTRMLFLDSQMIADREGFARPASRSGHEWRGAFEERSATTRWANLAGFHQVDAMATIRTPKGFTPVVGGQVFIERNTFTIMGIENVKNRGRYLILFLRKEVHRG
ncbi:MULTISPECIES: head-tail adaptor protein [Boudabousia]|nr:hypothetical protein [Boudabousia liubingyangii]OKL47008.1 hypothetical protein BSR28_06210 [Boudabousia liubingyangii]